MYKPIFILIQLIAISIYAQPFTDSNIPIVVIDTHGGTIISGTKINADFKIINNGVGIRNYVSDIPAFAGNIGIELHGSYSLNFPQLSYGFKLKDSMGANLDTSLLDMPSEHDWLLISNYNDKAFSRNTLAGELFRKMGNYAPRSKFCEVIVDGDYKGIYLLYESIKRDKHRVNIAKLDSTDVTMPNVTGGYILKNDYWTISDSWQSNFHPIGYPTSDVHIGYHYPKFDAINQTQKNYIQDFINQFETTLYSNGFTNPLTGFRQYADELTFADYFYINELSRNYDGFMHSYFFNKDNVTISKLKCGPVWDFDWGFKNITVSNCSDFGATDGSGWAYLINDCNAHSVNSTAWHIRMLQDSAFKNTLYCRWKELRLSALDTINIFHHIDSVASYLNEAQLRHYTRWGSLTLDVGGCHVPPMPTSFPGHVSQLKNWIKLRLNWLDNNMPRISNNCFTDINQLKVIEPSILVFPNPSSNIVYIESQDKLNSFSVICYDQSGRAVINSNTKKNKTQSLNISDLSDGMYLLQITNGEGTRFYQKLVVLH